MLFDVPAVRSETCACAITQALRAQDPTAAVDVKLDDRRVRVEGQLSAQQALAAIQAPVGPECRGENSAARGQIFDASPAHSGSMGQEAAEIWTAQTDLQPGDSGSTGALAGFAAAEAPAHSGPGSTCCGGCS
jgi:copper chaperone